jgi:hypothetical protein
MQFVIVVKSGDGNLRWQGLRPLGKFAVDFSFTCLEVEISLKLQNEVWMSKLINTWFVMCKWHKCLARRVNGTKSGCKGVKTKPNAMGGIKELGF